MAESLTGMTAEALRWKAQAGNSQDKYKGHWNQWRQWCQIPHKELSANTLPLGAFYILGVFDSTRLEYPETWQPTWVDCQYNLGHPLASSGTGGV